MTIRRVATLPAGMPWSLKGRARFRSNAVGLLGPVMAAAMLSALVSVPASAQPAAIDSVSDNTVHPAEEDDDGANSAEPGLLVDTEGEGTGLWVVELEEPSLATYSGSVAGLRPTSPQITGAHQLDVKAPASRAYLAHLSDQQDELHADIDRALGRLVDVEYEYRNIINGLAVRVDKDEAQRLTRLPGVAAVYRDVKREMLTDVSHDLIRSASIWNGTTADDIGTRGEGVLVGIIDGGINPSHPSFAATDGDGYTHTNPFGAGNYVGVCDPDHPAPEDICNDKLVGAWNFHPASPSAQDADGHGSHTASTAVGNIHEATVTIGGGEFTRTVQGVAPRANVISYLVCHPTCPSTSTVAAVEQAIEDGVDVLNYSISGSDNPWADVVDRAFLEAFNAGIFVAASAGNNGPGASTAVHSGPWNAAVAATTHYRAFANSLDITGPEPVPAELVGRPATPGNGPAVGADIETEIRDVVTVDPGNEHGCLFFPPGAFEAAIALIDGGRCPYSWKVNSATNAGALAVVVINETAGPPMIMGGLEGTTIPAVMIERDAGAALRTFIADHTGPITARLNATTGVVTDHAWEDIVAGFSSRGPSQFDLITPTFAAPGVDILAAGAGAAGDPDRYLVISGTSMASPHGAGAGALLTALHPDWTPAEIRSALALTGDAHVLKEDGTTPADPLDVGSGRIDLDSAGRIGLVMDETYSDFVEADPASSGDPNTLNLPSLVDDTCVESCSWARTVRNVAAVEATYAADVTAPDGMMVTVEPAEFTLAPGAEQTVEVAVDADLSVLRPGRPVFGEVGFDTDAVHTNGRPIAAVNLPVVATPRAPASPKIDVDPSVVTRSQRVGEVVGHTLTLGNVGTSDLNWEIYEDTALRRPRGETTHVETVEPPALLAGRDDGRHALDSTSSGDNEVETVVPEQKSRPGADQVAQTLTHSNSQAVVPGNTIACTPSDAPTMTSANAYLRTFALDDFGIEGGFDVTNVEFGIETLTARQALTVNIYTMIDPGAPLTYDNLELIGSGAKTFAAQDLTLASVPVTGLVEPGSTLVVEVSAPDMSGIGGFWPGSNNAGQTAPSYLRTDDCGITEPADLAALGYPRVDLVMNVVGEADAPRCSSPDDMKWLDVAPRSGTLVPDATGVIELTVDSTGVKPSTLSAMLCLRSNDPRHLLTTVPLEVTVIGDGVSTGDAVQSKLTAEGLPGDQLGNAVAIDGDTAVVGAFDAAVGEFTNLGAAYVYTRTDDGWLQQATLLPPEEDRDWGMLFGRSVAVDGDTIVVGATGAHLGDSRPGAAYVFVRDGGMWTQQAKLSTNDVRWGANLGASVDIDGDTVAVGAPDEHIGDNNVQGVVYTFVRDRDTWAQGQRLTASNGSSFSNFGSSVRIDGKTMLIGAPNATVRDVFRQGTAYVFSRDRSGWTEQAVLNPSNPAANMSFGAAVDIDKGTAVIGASGPGFDWIDIPGAAYVYTGSGSEWTEQATLRPAAGHVNDRFGWSVAVDGRTIVAGASHLGRVAGVDLQKGAALVYTRHRHGWVEQRAFIAFDTAQGDHVGTSVAVSRADVLVGAPNATVGGNADQGAAYVFIPDEDAPAPPAISITPGELTAELNPGDTATAQLTIANSGAQDLQWEIDTESTVSGPLHPAGTTTAVETAPPPAMAEKSEPDGTSHNSWVDGPGEELSSSVESSTTGNGDELLNETDAVRLTHSTSMEVVEGPVPVCVNNDSGTTAENRFLRTFTLEDFGVMGAFDVDEVTFGVQLVTASAELTVNLYTLDGAFEYTNLTLLATDTVSVENLQNTLISVPIPTRVPAGSTLVIEVVAPDMSASGGYIVPGTNSAGQTAPSYVSADDCGAPNPVTMESLGYPDTHLVMAVDGTPVEPVSCELPEWLAVDPRSGTVAPGEEGFVDVAWNAAGLAADEYTAHVCVTSNDPVARIATVPVSLIIHQGGENRVPDGS